MKDSYLSYFHQVDLTEQKWFWSHKRKYVCSMCYWILSAGEGSVWLTALCLKAVFFTHSSCLANSPFQRKNCCGFNKCRATKSQTLAWQPKTGSRHPPGPPGVVPPHQLSLLSFLLLGTAAALHTEERAQPELFLGFLPGPALWAKWRKRRNLGKVFFSPMQLHSYSFPST